MKSYVKLYGPSIDKGIDALNELLKDLTKRYQYGEMVSHIISVVDPSLDLLTGKLIRKGREYLGDYDFVVEWEQSPTFEQVRGLIRQIDEALLYTGCRYSITTKD
ncbi:MAG: hypothetical protein JSV18_07415 [Candidatus Bathyarchaeota archaeon]|nr:MAG: hypothetical protein JSV18_07415 [Candidatus Bathyarchaeota archaeon]